MLGDDVTNNVAEYTAVIKGLRWLYENGMEKEKVLVFGDSMLVIKQMNGEYSVNSGRIWPLYSEAMELAGKFFDVRFQWVPRSRNSEADGLSRRAYEEFVKSHFNDFIKHYGRHLATGKQRRFIEYLGATPHPYMGRRDASKMIASLLNAKRRDARIDSFFAEEGSAADDVIDL